MESGNMAKDSDGSKTDMGRQRKKKEGIRFVSDL